MSGRILHLVAYDISNATRLRRVLHVVRDYATGGQKSVHECFLSSRERESLTRRLEAEIDSGEDAVFLLRLDTRADFRTLGIAIKPRDPSFFYVG